MKLFTYLSGLFLSLLCIDSVFGQQQVESSSKFLKTSTVITELTPAIIYRNDSVNVIVKINNASFTSEALIELKNAVDSNYLSFSVVTVNKNSILNFIAKVSKTAPGRKCAIRIINKTDSSILDTAFYVAKSTTKWANPYSLICDSNYVLDIIGSKTFFTSNSIRPAFSDSSIRVDSSMAVSDTLYRLWIRTGYWCRSYSSLTLHMNENDSSNNLSLTVTQPSLSANNPIHIGLGDTQQVTVTGVATRFNRVDDIYLETKDESGNVIRDNHVTILNYDIESNNILNITFASSLDFLVKTKSYQLVLHDSLQGNLVLNGILSVHNPVISKNIASIQKKSQDSIILKFNYLSPEQLSRLKSIEFINTGSSNYGNFEVTSVSGEWNNKECTLTIGTSMTPMIKSGYFLIRFNFPGLTFKSKVIQILKPSYKDHSPQLYSTKFPTLHNFIFSGLYDTGVTFAITSSPPMFNLDTVFVVGDTVKIIGQALREGAFSYEISSISEGLLYASVFYGNNNVGVSELSKEILHIYPVPATNVINVPISSDIVIDKINLTDVSGKAYIASWQRSDKDIIIDVQPLNSGLYFLQLQTSKGIQTVKFIHQ